MNDTFIIAWRSKARRSLRLDDKAEESDEDNGFTDSEIDFPLVTDEEEQEAVLI